MSSVVCKGSGIYVLGPGVQTVRCPECWLRFSLTADYRIPEHWTPARTEVLQERVTGWDAASGRFE